MIGRGGVLGVDVQCVVSGLMREVSKEKARTKRASRGAVQRSQRACKLGFIGAGELGKLCRRMRQITWLNWPTIEPVL